MNGKQRCSGAMVFVFLLATLLGGAPAGDAAVDRLAEAERQAEALVAAPPDGVEPAEAAMAVGWIYLFGMLGEPRPDMAEKHFQTAFDSGIAEAGVALGAIHLGLKEYGGGPRDTDRAVGYYEKAAEAGSVDALRMLGSMYAQGLHGVAADPELGRAYLLRAAERGSKQALEALDPRPEGDVVDAALAEASRARAERLVKVTGLVLEAMHERLGGTAAQTAPPQVGEDMLRRQEELAAKLRATVDRVADEVVAEQPDRQSAGDAALVVGVFHYMGMFHGIDLERAGKYLEKSLDLGTVEAGVALGELHLGLTLEGPEKPPRDVVKGLAYLEAAAAQHSPDALRLLGIVYADGVDGADGLPADPEKAKGYFLAAAKHGDDEALERLESAFAAAAQWETDHPGQKADFPSSRDAVVDPQLAAAAKARIQHINVVAEATVGAMERRVLEAMREELGE